VHAFQAILLVAGAPVKIFVRAVLFSQSLGIKFLHAQNVRMTVPTAILKADALLVRINQTEN